jgi:hypothetical protein
MRLFWQAVKDDIVIVNVLLLLLIILVLASDSFSVALFLMFVLLRVGSIGIETVVEKLGLVHIITLDDGLVLPFS